MIKKESWFDVSFWEEERTSSELNKALEICYELHVWTVQAINEHWQEHQTLPKFSEFRPIIARRIRGSKWVEHVQRYTLDRVVEQTFPHVAPQLKSQKKKGAEAVAKAKTPQEFNTIQIEARKIWRKHLAEDRGITTVYGILFPEGEWRKIVREGVSNVDTLLVPYLWHSITLQKIDDDTWRMKFNFHDPSSKKGKEAKKELKQDAENLLSK